MATEMNTWSHTSNPNAIRVNVHDRLLRPINGLVERTVAAHISISENDFTPVGWIIASAFHRDDTGISAVHIRPNFMIVYRAEAYSWDALLPRVMKVVQDAFPQMPVIQEDYGKLVTEAYIDFDSDQAIMLEYLTLAVSPFDSRTPAALHGVLKLTASEELRSAIAAALAVIEEVPQKETAPQERPRRSAIEIIEEAKRAIPLWQTRHRLEDRLSKAVADIAHTAMQEYFARTGGLLSPMVQVFGAAQFDGGVGIRHLLHEETARAHAGAWQDFERSYMIFPEVFRRMRTAEHDKAAELYAEAVNNLSNWYGDLYDTPVSEEAIRLDLQILALIDAAYVAYPMAWNAIPNLRRAAELGGSFPEMREAVRRTLDALEAENARDRDGIHQTQEGQDAMHAMLWETEKSSPLRRRRMSWNHKGRLVDEMPELRWFPHRDPKYYASSELTSAGKRRSRLVGRR
jgi:hypothetical protein